MVIFSTTPPVQATGTSPAIPCLRRSLARTSRTNSTRSAAACLQNRQGNRVAGLGQLVDGRRERGKVRSGRAVTQAHQVFKAGRTPDLAHFFKNLRGLLAVKGMERPSHAVQPDPVAGAFVAQPRAIAAGALAAAVGRAADGVRAGSGNLQDSGAALKGCVQSDDFVAHHFGPLRAETP
jgi:hypothetical protein